MVAELHNRKVSRVPDLVGLPLRKAQAVLENAGFTVDAVLFRESYEERDTVLDQKPARGQMIYEGSPITMWVARRGYMEHLPAIYRRSDAVGRNVVRDICFLFEHMFGSIEERLENGHRYYDPHECPPEFLEWLASWTAMVLDMDWPEAKKRAILKRSVDLYRIRGTKRGLLLFLKLFTDHEPRIDENEWPFKGFRVGTEARIALDSVVLPPVDRAHCFVVTMPLRFADVTPEMIIRIHQIIQMEKPAHTHYCLRFESDDGDVELREFFAIGLRSGIGIGAEVVKAVEDGAADDSAAAEAEAARAAAAEAARAAEAEAARAAAEAAREAEAEAEAARAAQAEAARAAAAGAARAAEAEAARTAAAEAAQAAEAADAEAAQAAEATATADAIAAAEAAQAAAEAAAADDAVATAEAVQAAAGQAAGDGDAPEAPAADSPNPDDPPDSEAALAPNDSPDSGPSK